MSGGIIFALLAGAPSSRNLLDHPTEGPAIGGESITGPISAAGGPFMRDAHGRVVFFHGLNAVYKHPPYELYPDQGKPWNFDARDAAAIARLGFNLVRLGITWSGIEPGTVGANNPNICRRGLPVDPHQFDGAVASAYLSRLDETVDLLATYHIYTLLDMHQDVYNEAFRGEGAPAWAVCTDGLPFDPLPGRWSNNYANPAADTAYDHFWRNDVAGDLQGEYDRSWTFIASHFANNPSVIGYDPFNEPFSRSLISVGGQLFDGEIECFYTGSAHPATLTRSTTKLRCAPQVPSTGLIPSILGADAAHLIFYEPDIFTSNGAPNFVGPMPYPRLVFNFHDYCSARSPVTGDPTDLAACEHQQLTTLTARSQERHLLGTRAQPGGPAWFMSEFGASGSSVMLSTVAGYADEFQVGWAYWEWKYYNDPTGSSDDALVRADGSIKPAAAVLSEAFPLAVAGTPTETRFDSGTGGFALEYVAARDDDASTIISVPQTGRYQSGYCLSLRGANAARRGGTLIINNRADARRVSVAIRPRPCH
jgi:endoglycosylceramidase